MGYTSVLFAVDWQSLRVQGQWAGGLGIVCGVFGALAGSLIPRKVVAGAIGGALGAVAAYVCARLYSGTYGYDSCAADYLTIFLPVGVLCGYLSAFKASPGKGRIPDQPSEVVADNAGTPSGSTGEPLAPLLAHILSTAHTQARPEQLDSDRKRAQRAAGLFLTLLAGAATTLTWRAALVMGQAHAASGAIFAVVLVFGLGLIAFPIDATRLRPDTAAARRLRFWDLPAAWKIFPVVAVIAGLASWFALSRL